MTVDWARTEQADRNRAAKVAALIDHALLVGRYPAYVTDRKARRAFERDAGVRECSDYTWQCAVAAFRERVAQTCRHCGERITADTAEGVAEAYAAHRRAEHPQVRLRYTCYECNPPAVFPGLRDEGHARRTELNHRVRFHPRPEPDNAPDVETRGAA